MPFSQDWLGLPEENPNQEKAPSFNATLSPGYTSPFPSGNILSGLQNPGIDPGFVIQPGMMPVYVTPPLPPAVATPIPSWWTVHKAEVLVGAAIVATLVLADILLKD